MFEARIAVGATPKGRGAIDATDAHDRAYRPDIDGLRAIAVLSVVLYHFGFGFLRGGFVGVDVFFVISGFLITGIIVREVDGGRFTFARFYERRIRRIFPALFAMLLVVAAVAWVEFLPSDMRLLEHSMLSTLLFSSNVFYWRNSGYFDTVSELNPLLHTWSLAVEEQFYCLFPIALIVATRYARRALVPLAWVAVVASFSLCVLQQSERPTATFYLLPFRAWELGIGALISLNAFAPPAATRARELLAAVGLSVLLASLVLVPSGAQFPGWLAAFPVLGTALVLHANQSGRTVVGAFLASRALVAVGLMSYSLYLWHLPVHVFALYRNGLQPLGAMAPWLIALSFALGFLSYRFVERPFRRARQSSSSTSFFLRATAAMAFVGVVGFGLALDNGWESRFPARIVQLDAQRKPEIPFEQCDGNPSVNMFRPDCRLGDHRKPATVILWGDSHALAWGPVFDELLSKAGIGGIVVPNSNCPPLFDVANPVDPLCMHENDYVRQFLAKHSEAHVVVLHASWMKYSATPGDYSIESRDGSKGNHNVFPTALQNTVHELRSLGKKVVLIGPTPGSPVTPTQVALGAVFGIKQRPARPLSNVKLNSASFSEPALAVADSVTSIDPSPAFCDAESCEYAIDGTMLYRDMGHINTDGAHLIVERLGPSLIEAVSGVSGVSGVQSRGRGESLRSH